MQLTAIALVVHILLLSAGAVMAYIAMKAADRCDALGQELLASSRRLKAVQDQILVFEERLNRLSGRVYAQSRRPKPTEEEPLQPDELDPELAAELALQTAPPASPGATPIRKRG